MFFVSRRIPCDECDATFKNMVQLKNHRLGGECPGQAASIAKARAEQADDGICKVGAKRKEKRKRETKKDA